MKNTIASLLLLLPCLVPAQDKPTPLGYTDTPVIPGSEWRVHDLNRPKPMEVKPADKLGAAPADAVVLFDGSSTDAFYGKKKDSPDKIPCPWKVENGELLVAGGDCWTKEEFGSCQLHLEWMSEPHTKGNSQKKGNGGVFLMDRYESQILDCDNNPTYADGMAGAIYGQTPPLVNAVRKAGQWQVYDITFKAPVVKDGKVVEPARITSFVNGVCTQNNTVIMGPTKHKDITDYLTGTFPAAAPLRIQDHKNEPPVRLRNLWVRRLP
jgi:hypothetical protein